jgi:hypothetical protein
MRATPISSVVHSLNAAPLLTSLLTKLGWTTTQRNALTLLLSSLYLVSRGRSGDIVCGMDGSEEIRDMHLYVHDERLQASGISIRMKMLPSSVSEDETIAYPNLVGSSAP